MPDLICTIPIPQTPQELEQAIKRYRESDATGIDLFCQWQAIRDVSLRQVDSESQGDGVAVEHSY